jgi:hypothetical protein
MKAIKILLVSIVLLGTIVIPCNKNIEVKFETNCKITSPSITSVPDKKVIGFKKGDE